MMRKLLSNRSKNHKQKPLSETATHQSIKSLRIGQKILNNFHINRIYKDKPKTNNISKVDRSSQSLKVDSINLQGLFIIENTSNVPKQCFNLSNPSSKFYKRERNQQEQHNHEGHKPSFTQRFASSPAKNRCIAERHRRIKRMRNMANSDCNIDSQRKVKTEYDEQQGDHGDSFIFRPLRANAYSQDQMELESPPQKQYDGNRYAINLTINRILLPRYQSKPLKVMQTLRKMPIDGDLLGPRQHPYTCILKHPQRFTYGKYTSICQQLVKSTKRP